jgi:hypothetical protein
LTEEWFILLSLVILLTITVSGLTEEWFILLWLLILNSNWEQYNQPQQYDPLLCQT